MRLTPKSFRPPASPSRWRMRLALKRANSGGYPTPLRSGTAAMSILGMAGSAEVAGAELDGLGVKGVDLLRRRKAEAGHRAVADRGRAFVVRPQNHEEDVAIPAV